MNKIYQHQNNINTKIFLVHIRDFCLFGIHVICLKKKEKKRMNTEMFHTVTDSLQGMRN